MVQNSRGYLGVQTLIRHMLWLPTCRRLLRNVVCSHGILWVIVLQLQSLQVISFMALCDFLLVCSLCTVCTFMIHIILYACVKYPEVNIFNTFWVLQYRLT